MHTLQIAMQKQMEHVNPLNQRWWRLQYYQHLTMHEKQKKIKWNHRFYTN